MKKFVLTAAVLALLAGCSVKEDRSGCPCILDIDFSALDPEVCPETVVAVASAEGTVLLDSISSQMYGRHFSVPVPKGSLVVDMYSGWPWTFSPGTGFTAGYGEQFPELYLHAEAVSADTEYLEVKAVLHKSYCRVNIYMKSEGKYPYSLSVQGSFCGYDALGAVLPGPFMYAMAPGQDGKCSVCIPRQADSSLRLVIKENENTLREFALGEYIVKSGYDWSLPDLKDIDIEIDYAKTDIVFKVNEWETTISFDVII